MHRTQQRCSGLQNALADNLADLVRIDVHGGHLRCPVGNVLTRLRDSLEHDFVQNAVTGNAALLERLLDDVRGQAVDLDVDLNRGDALLGTSYLEVHVAVEVLNALNIGEGGLLTAVVIRPQEMPADIPILDGLADSDTADGMAVKATVDQLRKIFDIVRLVDPTANAVLELDHNGILRKTDQHCAAFWETGGNCTNCISTRALAQKTMLNKLEFTRTDMYYVVSKYLCINGTPCVMEMLSKMNEGRWIDANGTRFLLDKSRGESRKLFQDPLTATYSRRYFETYLTHMEGMECVEIIDVNQSNR